MRQAPRGLGVLLLLGAAALALFPLVGGTFYVQLVAKIMILAVFAMSLDLLVGCTGLVSLGHAAFYGLGAYVLVLAAPQYEAASLWVTLPLAMAVAAAAALVIGALALRTSGVYFIMVTLAFAQMLYYLFHDTKIGGGSDGTFIYVKPEASLFGVRLLDLGNLIDFYYLSLAVLVITYVFLRVVLASLFGQVILGIKANEHRMRSLGYPTFRYKLASFTLAGALAGLSGHLAASQFGFVNPELLGWHMSGDALLMVILGGMGTLFGPVLGAFAMVLLQEIFTLATEHWLLPMGATVVLVALALPEGLAGLLLRLLPPPGRDG